MNQETGLYLSKTNLFTSLESEYLKTNKTHADWLLQQFQKENEYLVELVEFE